MNCNINAKLNYKTSAVFCNLKDYGSQHFMQKMGKLNLKINVIPYLLERYLSFTIDKMSSFIESVQFLRFSFDSLSKDDFPFLTQKFDNNVLDLVKQKRFDPCEFMSDFQKFKEERFYSPLTSRKKY